MGDSTPTLSQHWRTLKTAARLGWAMESNWTDPLMFTFYSIVKPISGTLILVFMYWIIGLASSHAPSPNLFAYLYVGNALFIYVAQVLFGLGSVIEQEREWFQTIRYLYISPISLYTYLLGRAATQVAMATIAFVVTLTFGYFVLQIPLVLDPLNVPWLIAAMVLGILAIATIAIALASLTFMTARHARGIAEGIPGLFYLFCGVVFPISVLPAWGQAVGAVIPLTYWFAVVRRLLLPGAAAADGGLPSYTLPEAFAVLATTALLAFLVSILVYRGMEASARRRGRIDSLSGY